MFCLEQVYFMNLDYVLMMEDDILFFLQLLEVVNFKVKWFILFRNFFIKDFVYIKFYYLFKW